MHTSIGREREKKKWNKWSHEYSSPLKSLSERYFTTHIPIDIRLGRVKKTSLTYKKIDPFFCFSWHFAQWQKHELNATDLTSDKTHSHSHIYERAKPAEKSFPMGREEEKGWGKDRKQTAEQSQKLTKLNCTYLFSFRRHFGTYFLPVCVYLLNNTK